MSAEVSELLDEALDDATLERVVETTSRQASARRAWADYCLIGDSLRGLDSLSPGFTARTMGRLAQEPTVLAPVARRRRGLAGRIALPIAASVMGVAVVAWVARDSLSPAPVELARVDTVRPPAAAPQTVVSVESAVPAAATADRPEVTSYLFAHSAYVPSRTMQGVAPYVRVVQESGSGTGR